MKILSIESLALAEVKLVRYGRFLDQRGYFCEHFRKSDFDSSLTFLNGLTFVQCNESYSRPGTIRGLHFQWNPFVGKLIRTVHGHMVDLVLDIRKGAPTIGKIIACDMPADPGRPDNQWIWVPPGFAHGNVYLQDTTIEYFCTGEYNPACEAGISPLAPDLDWSLCEPSLRTLFAEVARQGGFMSAKDRAGLSLNAWDSDDRSRNFQYQACSWPPSQACLKAG